MASAVAGATVEKVPASFEPSVWDNFFVDYEPQPLQRSEEWMKLRADKLKDDVSMLFKTCSSTVGRMNLVDAIQRLGIDHLFDEEIDAALSNIHGSEFISSSLHDVALRFRLLREHALWVSPEVFYGLMDEDGRFTKNITNEEPRGLLSLYNAAYLFVSGEPQLEEAISVARQHLESMRADLKSPLGEQVERALYLPLTRTYKRKEAVHYMSEYGEEEGHNPSLLELAKLDFNLLQHVHLKELNAISKWWKDLYGSVKLSYSRDRIVEAYFWSYSVFYEPCFARARMIFGKIIALFTFMDDTYDVHATIEECRQLNAAIQRWDESAVFLLPEYLKSFYSELLSNIAEFQGELAIDNYKIAYAKKAFQNQSTYYLQEAEWSHQNHKPSFEDQVTLSTMSSAVPMLSVIIMICMGDAVEEGAAEWALGIPEVIIASAKIGRFMNDIAAFKHGKNRGDVASSVECYINEYGVTGEVAIAKINSLIEDEWKATNQARFKCTGMPQAVKRVINFTLSWPVFYDDMKDGYTFGEHLQETIESLFVKPVPI